MMYRSGEIRNRSGTDLRQIYESFSKSPKSVLKVHRCLTYQGHIRDTSGTRLGYMKGSVSRSAKQVL